MIPITCDNNKLFEFVYDTIVYGSGGDGHGIIQLKSQDLEVVVLEFETFLKNKEPKNAWEKTFHTLFDSKMYTYQVEFESISLCDEKYEIFNDCWDVIVRTS